MDYPEVVLVLMLLILVPLSCSDGQQANTRLQQWDALLDEHPEAVLDSLRQLDPVRLTPADRAYHGLLETIATDKAYGGFASDSLANETERYYHKRQPGGNDHIRALIYQGIARIRLGDKDTSAYMPFGKAKKLFSASKDKIPSNGFLLNFYLGDLHYKKANYDLANDYYKKSLGYARLENAGRHLFDAYAALFWNEMTRGDHGAGKLYLDTLSGFKTVSNDTRFSLLNMQSVYHDSQGEYERSLRCEKEMLRLLPSLQYDVDAFRTFFSISDKYKDLNQPDSALHYGLQAIRHINDSTYELNYLLYKNVADIALQQGNYKMAEEYRAKMFEIYEYYVDGQTDNAILELEKRYDLTEARNAALQSKANARLLSVAVLSLLLLSVFLSSVYYKQRMISRLEAEKLQAEKSLAESETKLLQIQTDEQIRVINIYSPFLALYSNQLQQLSDFGVKFNNSSIHKQKLAESYAMLLDSGKEEFDRLLTRLFPSDLFERLFKQSRPLDFLSAKDKLLLVMLAHKFDNTRIAAFLNISPANLKSRKAQIKKKITENASKIDNIEPFTTLFRDFKR